MNKTANNTLRIQGVVLERGRATRQKTARAKGNNNLTESGVAEVHGVEIQDNQWREVANCQIPQTMLMVCTHVTQTSDTYRNMVGGYNGVTGDYDMMHMACESPPPCRSVSTGISNGWFDGISKDSFEGTSSPSFLGSRNVKSRNESMARDVEVGESESEGHLAR